jgi:hypothetical protein
MTLCLTEKVFLLTSKPNILLRYFIVTVMMVATGFLILLMFTQRRTSAVYQDDRGAMNVYVSTIFTGA